SRRRHTRFSRDWSSDVCSSDLAGADVFLESLPDDPEPYAQQAVGWVVRLYSAVPLVSGQLDQPAPAGATLRQVGDDAQYTRSVRSEERRVGKECRTSAAP